ncbi:MAG: gamma-glutamyltransferase [Acidobacteriota bacterium]
MSRPPSYRARGLSAVLLVVVVGGCAPAAERGAVATSESDATAAGLAILEAGGNAVDAAVAAALALSVVHPEAGNLGGGGFAVVRVGGELAALDFRETAPADGGAAMFLDAAGEPVPDASRMGGLAAGVPGSPAGYHELHRRFGRLPWRRVVEPAIRLARDGFTVSARTADSLAEERDRLGRYPATAERWLPGGRPAGWGERVRLPELAATLERYAELGPAAITEGETARAVAAAARAHGGVLDAADLAAYRPVWREPLRFEALGWSFATMPLPSSGGVILAEALGLLERRDALAAPPASAERVHLVAEVLRRAFADRYLLGDPDGSTAAPAALLVPSRLDLRAGAIDLTRTTPSSVLDPGGTVAAIEPSETTHVSVIDADGGAVALTTTINDLFGGAVWVEAAGFFLNDEMDDFTTAPGVPNLYGIVQGEANRIAAGRRPLSSMSPTLVWQEGGAQVALGGRGGSRIPTGVLCVLLALADGDGLRAAVARPRVHHQWLPDRLELEAGALDAAARTELERLGHVLADAGSVGKVNAVARLADGSYQAAGDPRALESGGVLGGDPDRPDTRPLLVANDDKENR